MIFSNGWFKSMVRLKCVWVCVVWEREKENSIERERKREISYLIQPKSRDGLKVTRPIKSTRKEMFIVIPTTKHIVRLVFYTALGLKVWNAGYTNYRKLFICWADTNKVIDFGSCCNDSLNWALWIELDTCILPNIRFINLISMRFTSSKLHIRLYG